MKITILFLLLFLVFSPHAVNSESVEHNDQPQKYYRSFGSILPVTGKFSKLGERSLKGIRTAIQHAAQFGQYHVFVKDTKSTSEGASAAYRQLVSEITPLFIIGPVPSNHINLIEEYNASLNQPLVIFPVFDVNSRRKDIVSFYLPIDNQVKNLVNFSIGDLKIKKFAVLYPDTGAGKLFSKHFSHYLNVYGGKIVYKGAYNPDLSDLNTHIKWLESYKFDAIFIPDGAKNSTFVIKNIISDDDITNVIFLGPNTWNSEIFFNLSKNDFDGIVHKIIFTDFINKESEDWINFSNLYKALFNEEPGSYEYQVYLATIYFLEKDLNQKILSGNNSLKPKPHIFTIQDGRILRLK